MINGFSLGSMYALIAIGYTMVYGVLRLINFAHGDIMMVGGFLGFFGIAVLDLPFSVSVLLAIVGAALLEWEAILSPIALCEALQKFPF